MLRPFIYLLYSLYFFIIIVTTYGLFSIPILAIYPFLGKKRHRCYAFVAKYWAKATLIMTGLYPRVRGTMPKNKGPYIYLFNHQSQLDILIALAFLPPGFLIVAKEELFAVPVLGFSMRRCGYIPIKRNQARKATETLEQLNDLIQQGTSILIFPEGTRSLTGKIGPIKRGSIMVAFETKTPLLPIVINPAYQIMPKGSLFLQPHRLKLQIGEPLIFDWSNRERDYTMKAAETIENVLSQQLTRLA